MSPFTLHFAPNRARRMFTTFISIATITIQPSRRYIFFCVAPKPRKEQNHTDMYLLPYLQMYIFIPRPSVSFVYVYTIWKIYGNCVSFGCDYDDMGCGTERYMRVEAGRLSEIYSSAYVRLLNFSNLWFVSVYVQAGCGVLLCLMFYSCSNLVFEAALPNGLL